MKVTYYVGKGSFFKGSVVLRSDHSLNTSRDYDLTVQYEREALLEECARDLWNNHNGESYLWPLKLKVLKVPLDKEKGESEFIIESYVNIEHEPRFYTVDNNETVLTQSEIGGMLRSSSNDFHKLMSQVADHVDQLTSDIAELKSKIEEL